MPTIKEIASMAGVAQSTVSHVLNGSKYVSKEIKEKVNDAILKTGYSPNTVARSLRTNRSGLIGIVVPDLSNFFFNEIICALEEELFKKGYSIVLGNYHHERTEEFECIQTILNRGIDGLVLICSGTQFDKSPVLEGFPIVTIDRRQKYPCSTVLVDNVEGGYLATSLLCCKNRKRILLLTDIVKSDPFFERFVGYRKALAEYEIPYDANFVFEAPISFSEGSHLMEEILSSKIGFDAIFSTSYYCTLGVMRILELNKFRIPEDISLVSYDSPMESAYTYPAISVIQQPTDSMGRTAANLIISRINGEETASQTLIHRPILIERETT
jgi:LacI family transcriptional regulator